MNVLIERLSTVAAGCLVLASGMVFAQSATTTDSTSGTTVTTPERAQQINRSGANTGAGNIASTLRHDATEGGTVVSGTRTDTTTTTTTTTTATPMAAAPAAPAADTSATAVAPTPPAEPAVAAAPLRSARSDRN
jgi:hypothetical protein